MMFRQLSLLSRRAPALLAAVLIASCGGGVDSGGTGAPVASFASGTITGFGSVIVAGVHFDDRTAAVSDADGNARSRDDLRLGMSVDARGSDIASDADGNPSSTASSIVIRSEIVGPVGANNPSTHAFSVLGQNIDVTATTVFDSALSSGQGSLAVGDVVEVYASFNAASGRYLATRVERKIGAAGFVLRGIVANLDTVARTFSIGATRISFASLSPQSVPASLANGGLLRVSLGLSPGAGAVWTATALGDRSPALDDRNQAKVEGLVSAFTSPTQFAVNGTPVDARGAQFPDGSAGLALGQRVEVEGSVAGGVLVATRVRIVSDSQESGKEFDVRGLITSLDVIAKTFVVRNVVVSYAGAVDFRDGSAVNLRVGADVEARGLLSADGTRLQAARIDFRH